jgi:murein DD-endopeptidase MepM/ murein hydrolase activator NlpD
MVMAVRAFAVVLPVILGACGCNDKGGCQRERPEAAAKTNVPAPVVSAFRHTAMPTDRDRIDPKYPETFQPTASGDPQSALYGSVRMARFGNSVAPSFHEGIDIAPLHRNAHGQPEDAIYAVADGKVAYVNRYAGNSNYGNYIVLTHADPIGEVYTLYAHLAAVPAHLHPGARVQAGATIGLMGHTPPSIIPAARAHLHFEVGMIANARFGSWFQAKKLLPDHGAYNGLNLQGLSPLVFFKIKAETSGFDFAEVLRETPVAFEVLLATRHELDYFRRYPSLWRGDTGPEGWVVLACSENGSILSGRVPDPDEMAKACRANRTLLSVNEEVLGRNGCHLVVKDNGKWRFGAKANQWLEILEY